MLHLWAAESNGEICALGPVGLFVVDAPETERFVDVSDVGGAAARWVGLDPGVGKVY